MLLAGWFHPHRSVLLQELDDSAARKRKNLDDYGFRISSSTRLLARLGLWLGVKDQEEFVRSHRDPNGAVWVSSRCIAITMLTKHAVSSWSWLVRRITLVPAGVAFLHAAQPLWQHVMVAEEDELEAAHLALTCIAFLLRFYYFWVG